MLMSFEEIKPKIGWNLDRSAITRGTQQSIECVRAYSSLAASLASFTDRSTVSTFDMQKYVKETPYPYVGFTFMTESPIAMKFDGIYGDWSNRVQDNSADNSS